MTRLTRYWWLCLFANLLAINTKITQAPEEKTCSLNGTNLFGSVQIVESFADFKVQVVTSFPDLKVQVVETFPDACGKWQIVDTFPDFTIQYVDAFPDLKIQFVDAFPGKPRN